MIFIGLLLGWQYIWSVGHPPGWQQGRGLWKQEENYQGTSRSFDGLFSLPYWYNMILLRSKSWIKQNIAYFSCYNMLKYWGFFSWNILFALFCSYFDFFPNALLLGFFITLEKCIKTRDWYIDCTCMISV